MIQAWTSLAAAAQFLSVGAPMEVQFGRGVSGRSVMVMIDGREVRTTFAGKLAFRGQSRSWTSVCAEVRRPISNGQYFVVRPMAASMAEGTVAMAGNIVARYFREAQSADECAGLQLAVWEAVEDGGEQPNFAAGRFRVRATPAALRYAAMYYQAATQPGSATYMQTGPGGGQGQLGIA